MDLEAASEKKAPFPPDSPDHAAGTTEEGELVNASGHVQELDRSFGVFSVASIGLLSDNAWAAGGGSLVVALYNGGGPGVIYGLIVSIIFYTFIALGLAELSSAIPSSANVYHWASVTAGPKYGRICSWYAGWWNCLAWLFGAASSSLFAAETIIAMYSIYHPDYTPQRWQIFIAFVGVTWLDLSLVLFGQKILSKIATGMGAGMLLIFFITTLVCAIMPSQTGAGYASNSFVWGEWQNLTGWGSNGFVFLMGVLNGAYAIGTPDGVCHMCEEIPNPKKNIPLGVLAQMTTGSFTTFCFYIAVLYAITDLSNVFDSPITALPLAAIYQQATRNNAGTFGLLFLFLIDTMLNIPCGYITCGRMLWTLGRDDATPFSGWVRKVDPKWRNPFNAQLACGICVTILGAIYVGNATAFTAFVGSFTIFTTWSYCAALLPHILTKRRYITKPGPFWMSAAVAYPVIAIACAYILVFNIIYMFPYVYPVTVDTMNYAVVMTIGITVLLTGWYLWKRRHGYIGPQVALEGNDDIMTGVVGLSKKEEEGMRRASNVSGL